MLIILILKTVTTKKDEELLYRDTPTMKSQ